MEIIIEYIIIAIVFILQIYFFKDTFQEIKNLKYVFAELTDITIEVAVLSHKQLNSDINKIINDFYAGKLYVSDAEEAYRFSLIKISVDSDITIRKIVTSINKYILKDKSKVVDFNIIKDVVERNCENIDGEINNQLPIPLYLGLTGTMVGIVLGLLGFKVDDFFQSINNASANASSLNSIAILFTGVKTAMFASLIGLVLTIINTGIFYKKARKIVEDDKNEFYTFIQTELLPTISQSVSSSIIELNQGLNRFTEKFDKNINQLDSIVCFNIEALDSQNKLIQRVNELKPLKLTQTNLELFDRLETNLLEFNKFNGFIKGINSNLQATLQLNDKLESLLTRSDSLENIIESFVTNTEQAIGIQSFLQSNLEILTDRERALNFMTTKLDMLLQDSITAINAHTENTLKGFNESIQTSLQAITNQAILQVENLKESINIEEKSFIQIFTQHQQKLSDLSTGSNYLQKLEKLDDIVQKLTELDQTKQNTIITSYIDQQNKRTKEYSDTIKDIKNILNSHTPLLNGKQHQKGSGKIEVNGNGKTTKTVEPIADPLSQSVMDKIKDYFKSKQIHFRFKSKKTND